MSSGITSKLSSVRRSTDSLETERQNFIKHQSTSINKAINTVESPVKEKHVRNIIIGTFQEKGASTFWNLSTRLPVQGSPIVAWKFCHTLHKVLREGHEHVLTDSQKHATHLSDLGTMWSHMQEAYSKMIASYCQLLQTKLEFHKKNPQIPGNLILPDPEANLEKICENDINNFFQMTVEIFDYIDALIHVEETIFRSFDLSKNISMTNSGQCRVAPFMSIILDCGQLYDFSVRLMYKLHACLPADTLDGHRDRFLKQFRKLKDFFHRSGNLSYFRRLIQVPNLPQEPPNFFLAYSGSAVHISHAVMLNAESDGGRESPTWSESVVEEPIPRMEETISNSSLLVDLTSPYTNGASFTPPPMPPQPDDRDQLIDQLRLDVEQLRFELERTKKEDQKIINDLKRRLMEMESEMNEQRQLIETTYQENEDLKVQLDDVTQASAAVSLMSVSSEQVDEAEKKAVVNEEKFKKMKEVYAKLREEHVSLIRKNADVNKQLSTVSRVTEEQQQARQHAERFAEQLQQSVNEKKSAEEDLRRKMNAEQRKLLVSAIEEAEDSLRHILLQMEDPQFATATCTAEYLLTRSDGINNSLQNLSQCFNGYKQNPNDLSNYMKSISSFSHKLGDYLLQGKATSNMAPIHLGDSMSSACRVSGEKTLALLGSLKTSSQTPSVPGNVQGVETTLKDIERVAKELLPEQADIKEDLGDIIEQEMQSTVETIDKAAARIQEMLRKSREADTGVKLEVNEKILVSSTELMRTIKVLIEKSRSLQNEIVAERSGTAAPTEFYKRNHRWTEGLISAAKQVGVGATHLVDASDKLMQGKGKFEELVVCSHEIAACTAQLTVASKVKADKDSTNLKALKGASKEVSTATAGVVASAKSGAEMVEEGESLDFTNLSLTQTKRLEMDSQVLVLELESKLQKERVKLADLRKQHYSLAGASEGWGDEDDDKQAGGDGTTVGLGGVVHYV